MDYFGYFSGNSSRKQSTNSKHSYMPFFFLKNQEYRIFNRNLSIDISNKSSKHSYTYIFQGVRKAICKKNISQVSFSNSSKDFLRNFSRDSFTILSKNFGSFKNFFRAFLQKFLQKFIQRVFLPRTF